MTDTEAGEFRASGPSWAVRELLTAAAIANHVIARQLGLGLTDLTALDHLLADGPLGTTELAGRLGLRSPSATAVLDRLEATGHVRRTAHPTDRRRVQVEPTPAAQERAELALRPLVAELDELAAGLTPQEQELVARYFRDVAGVLRRHTGT